MSVLGISWQNGEVVVSCQPDPTLQPQRLDRLCGSPALLQAERAFSTELSRRSAAADLTAGDQDSDDVLPALLSRFLEVVDADEIALTQMMGSVEHIALLLPSARDGSRASTLLRLADRLPVPLTAVAYPSAAIAGEFGRCLPRHPYLLCEWNEDLVLSMAFSYDDPAYFSRTGPRWQVKDVGPRRWRRLIEAGLKKASADGAEERWPGTELRLSNVDPCERAELLVGELLCPARNSGTQADSLDKKNAPADESPKQPLIDALSSCLFPIPQIAGNLFKTCLDQIDTGEPLTGILMGPGFAVTAHARIARELLQAKGHRVVDAEEASVLRGLHLCVRPRPKLPYDCGVVIKKPGASSGIGTLILTRAMGIGDSCSSEEFVVAGSPGETMEVAFYLRHLDLEAEQVNYEVMHSHLFAPRLDAKSRARLSVMMCVDTDPDASDRVTVNIDLKDRVSKDTLRFPHLPVVGGQRMERPPLRDNTSVIGIDWGQRIAQVLGNLGEGDVDKLSLGTWWKLLPVYTTQKVKRIEYIRHILRMASRVAGIEMEPGMSEIHFRNEGKLLYGDNVETLDPERIQEAGRYLLFDAMRYLARQVVDGAHSSNHCRRWLEVYGRAAPPIDPHCANELLNVVSQDLAGKAEEGAFSQRLTDLPVTYSYLCSPPDNLNIQW